MVKCHVVKHGVRQIGLSMAVTEGTIQDVSPEYGDENFFAGFHECKWLSALRAAIDL